MPRQKCNRVNKNKILLMKNIKSRLIKISIKVENYIYKQKTISSIQAKTFLDEISSYEPLCEGDAEYLQVIGKLTKYLNILISHENSTVDNSINDKVNNTRESETYEIPNINSPMSEVVDKNITGDKNQPNFPKNKEHTEDCASSNKNENNKQVDDKIPTELTKDNINNDFELSTGNIKINTDKMSEMDSNTPLDLRRPVNKNSIIYSNWPDSLNKSIENINKPKVSGKVDRLDTATITEISNKLTILKLNKEVNCQDKPKNKFKTDNKCMQNENIDGSKSNMITPEQPLKTIQACTNTQFIQTRSFNIVFNSQSKTVRNSDNDVAVMAEEKLKEILHKNKTKSNISIQNEITKKNIINEDKVKKNLNGKPKNKRKTKKDMNVKEKKIKKETAKNVKRGVNKTKCSKTTNAKKSQTKQNLSKDVMKLDLSWFDNIKFIRQVDEQEYFQKK